MSNVITIYTDGSCNPNDKKGGWGFVHEEYEECGGQIKTTNNQMELLSVIKALQYAKDLNLPTTIVSDSQYVVKGSSEWMYSWFRGGKLNKIDLKNPELWLQLYTIVKEFKPKLEFRWVRGHNGDEFNEKADKLANKGRSTV